VGKGLGTDGAIERLDGALMTYDRPHDTVFYRLLNG
jgi:hypothetical protein